MAGVGRCSERNQTWKENVNKMFNGRATSEISKVVQASVGAEKVCFLQLVGAKCVRKDASHSINIVYNR